MTMRSLALLSLCLSVAGCEKASNPFQSGKSAAASAASQAVPAVTALLPGQWQTTMDIAPLDDAALALLDSDKKRQVADLLSGTTTTSAMCLPVDQARSPNATLIAGHDAGQCNFESFSLNRGTLDAVITCSQPGKPGRTLIAAHGTYAGADFALDAVLRVETDTPYDTVKGPMPTASGGPVRFHIRVTGKHQGECTAGEEVTS